MSLIKGVWFSESSLSFPIFMDGDKLGDIDIQYVGYSLIEVHQIDSTKIFIKWVKSI